MAVAHINTYISTYKYFGGVLRVCQVDFAGH